MPDGTGTEVQTIRRATRAAHRKAVRRRRPTAGSRHGVAHGDTVELNPAVAKRLKAGVQPDPITLCRERRGEQNSEHDEALHAPTLRRWAR